MDLRDDTDERPSALWARMTDLERLAAAEAFWSDQESRELHAEAIHLIADRMKFRPRSVHGLPIGKKARYLASTGRLPDSIAGRALVALHLAARRPMMAMFLDALGVAHQQGLITGDDVTLSDAARVRRAVTDLAAAYPARDVALYLSTLRTQDPETWGALAGCPESHLGPPA